MADPNPADAGLNPPADNGALWQLSYESGIGAPSRSSERESRRGSARLRSLRRRGRRLVGSAGNTPVVASGLLEDIGFTDRQPDHFPR